MDDDVNGFNQRLDERKEPANSLTEMRELLVSIKKDVSSGKKKDIWEKIDVVSKIACGFLIGAAGLLLTYYLNTAQKKISQEIGNAQVENQKSQLEIAKTTQLAQLEIAKRSQFGDYYKLITDSNNDPDKVALLISQLDLALPDQALRIARHYALEDHRDTVRISAIEVLSKYPEGRTILKVMAADERQPDQAKASELLGLQRKEVRIRLSEIDDIARAYVNSTKIIEVGLQNDSGWLDIRNLLKAGDNQVMFTLFNSQYGGWSARFQLSAGSKFYDSGRLGEDACPCNAPVLELTITVRIAQDGSIQFLSEPHLKRIESVPAQLD